MDLKLSNFNKPSEPKFKKIADTLLYALPLYLTAIVALPMDETTKIWITFTTTMLIITIKVISKLTAKEEDERPV